MWTVMQTLTVTLMLMLTLTLTLSLILNLTLTLPMTATDNRRNIYLNFTHFTSAFYRGVLFGAGVYYFLFVNST